MKQNSNYSYTKHSYQTKLHENKEIMNENAHVISNIKLLRLSSLLLLPFCRLFTSEHLRMIFAAPASDTASIGASERAAKRSALAYLSDTPSFSGNIFLSHRNVNASKKYNIKPLKSQSSGDMSASVQSNSPTGDKGHVFEPLVQCEVSQEIRRY